jgi:nucleotide-binding universal stress UspA family protein
VQLAAAVQGEIVVLAVLKLQSRGEAADEVAEEAAERRREVVAEMTAEALRDGVPPAVRVRPEIVEADQTTSAFDAYVREHGFDLVVVGRHGLDRAVHPRIGGVSEHQVRHGACPVLVVGSN